MLLVRYAPGSVPDKMGPLWSKTRLGPAACVNSWRCGGPLVDGAKGPLVIVTPSHYGWKWPYGWPAAYAKTCFVHNFLMLGPIAMKLCIGIAAYFVQHLVTLK